MQRLAYATVAALNTFNLIDLVTTYVALKNGNFQELNPVVLGLYKISPILMVLFKLVIVITVSVLLLRVKLDVNKIIYKGIYIGLFVGAVISASVLGYVSVHNIILLLNA